MNKSESDIAAAKEGCWLPSETELLEWLDLVDFDVSIQLTENIMRLHVMGRDRINQIQYSSRWGSLSYALYELIYKICKSKKRPYVPREIEWIDLSIGQNPEQ